MHARFLLALVCFSLATLATATPLDDAIALYKAKKYPEARAELEKITAADPTNAEACHYFGLSLRRTRDSALLEASVNWLKKAVDLQPDNTTYLLEYGSTSLMLAGKKYSLSAANHGRDALEKVIQLDPANLDAHEALYLFYQQAPWPVGSSAKASAHLEEIRKRDPDRAAIMDISTKTNAKDYAGAFKLCDDALARKPDNYVVLLQYSRVALNSGQNLDQALAGLKKCLSQKTPPNLPGPAFVHCRIGNLLEKMGDKTAARAAYETSLQVDSNFAQARSALEKLN